MKLNHDCVRDLMIYFENNLDYSTVLIHNKMC
nr:MAG TPA: hypothetical protein [Caudoviricetes sp.]